MKTKLLLSLSLLLFGSDCWGQITFQEVISTTYGGRAQDIQQTADNGYIIAGYINVSGSDIYDVYLIKTNEKGEILWTKIFGGIIEGIGLSVKETTDGGYIVAGKLVKPGQNEDIYIIKTNSQGDTLWTKSYGGSNADIPSYIQQTNDSGYIIAGLTSSFGAGAGDVYLIKIAFNGDISWTKTYGDSGDQSANCVKQTYDGGYIVCGSTARLGGDFSKAYLIKTNSTGDTLWTKAYGETFINTYFGYSVEQTVDSGYIITGNNASNSYNNVFLIKTDANGDTLWTKTYGGTGFDQGYNVQHTNDGGYIIGGYTTSFGIPTADFYLIKTDSKGDTLWTKVYGGTKPSVGYALSQTNDSGYIIAGYTQSFITNQNLEAIYLIKTYVHGNTGCFEGSTNTIVGYTPLQVESTNTIVGSGGTASPTNTIVGSGGNDSTLCSSVGIHEVSINNIISLYPNPAGSELRIKNEGFRIKTIAIYNVLGQEVIGNQYSIINNQYSINVSLFPSGLYIVRVADERQEWVGRFVKE